MDIYQTMQLVGFMLAIFMAGCCLGKRGSITFLGVEEVPITLFGV